MKKFITFLFTVSFLMLMANSAGAVSILIGDVDGFGFNNPNTYESAQDTNPDTDGDGILEAGEFLPDLDNDGSVHVNGSDEFDNRSSAEIDASNGAQFTDISLEDNYGDFGIAPTDDAFFHFNFLIDVPTAGDVDFGVNHYINLLFGDYDVTPMSIIVEGVVVPLTSQNNNSTEDGLIQLAYADVLWADMLDGIVEIDLVAPNEPYVTLDYAFLDTNNQAPPHQPPVPEPTTMLLFGLGLLGLAGVSRKKQ